MLTFGAQDYDLPESFSALLIPTSEIRLRAIAPQQKSTEPTSREQGRVLLITDDQSVSYRPALEAAGLHLVDVSAGVAALIALRRSRPHLVIASTAIKGLSIEDLGRTLAQTQDGLPLILVGSETATVERRRTALTRGAFDYFQMPAEIELLALRAKQLVTLSQTVERLHAEGDLDHLTGLANRRRFRLALNRELERWHRYGAPCALLMLDIDFMKAINDRYGHVAGDAVIRQVAGTLSRVSRNNDTAARVGGEEFALLLAGISDAKATAAAERLLAILAEQPVAGVGKVTVSIGVAACPNHANSARTLYAASDQALYDAKNQGRNRVAVAPLLQANLPGV
jgi:diguanylate cyclase (GGDEF)-like protein